MLVIPGVDFNAILDGRFTLGQAAQYYNTNVECLESLTQEQFIKEFPESWAALNHAQKQVDKLKKMMDSFENDQ